MNLILTLPWPPHDLSPNARVHWAALAKAKKSYRYACAIEAKRQGATRLDTHGLDVHFIFYPPSRRRTDLDNCLSRMKSGVDGLVDVLGVDDSKWRISLAMAGEIGGMVKVQITEMEAQDAR